MRGAVSSVALVLSLFACSHATLRLPASARPNYDAHHVQLLGTLAKNGIFVVVPDAVIRDLPVESTGEQCRKSVDAPWVAQLYSVLEVFQENPALTKKVHLIELRRGGRPQAELSSDLDGAVSLLVSYAKVETQVVMKTPAEIPCGASNLDLLGKEKTVTHFEWPQREDIATVLRKASDRPSIERLKVDHRFPEWLAERLTIFRLTPELAFEKTANGEPLLPRALDQLAHDIGQVGEREQMEFWLAEINHRSRLGASIQFFGLKKDSAGTRGIQVDSLGKFARKMSGAMDPTYLYVSYRVEKNAYAFTGLTDLSHCLDDLSATYRSAMSLMTTFEADADSFLYPGYHCQNNEGRP